MKQAGGSDPAHVVAMSLDLAGLPAINVADQQAFGFDSGVVVAPRIAPVVSPVGIPNIAFDGPSVTNPFGCTNRVVSPLPILSNQTVPSPVVA